MRFGKVALTIIAASGAVAMPSKAGNEPREVELNVRSASAGEVVEYHEKRFVWAIAFAGLQFFRWVNVFLNFMEDPPHAWETSSGNCAIEVKANTNADGRTQCSISASPAGESAFTEIKEWQSCSLGGENTFSFPDAPGRPSVGTVKVQWTEDGGQRGDGFWSPEIGFMDLSPPVFFSPQQDLESQGNVICDLQVDDGSLSDKWSGWNSYKCGVPCRDAPDDYTINT